MVKEEAGRGLVTAPGATASDSAQTCESDCKGRVCVPFTGLQSGLYILYSCFVYSQQWEKHSHHHAEAPPPSVALMDAPPL